MAGETREQTSLLGDGLNRCFRKSERYTVIHVAVIFLVVAMIAGLLGLSGMAGAASGIAWILFALGLVLAGVFYSRWRILMT